MTCLHEEILYYFSKKIYSYYLRIIFLNKEERISLLLHRLVLKLSFSHKMLQKESTNEDDLIPVLI